MAKKEHISETPATQWLRKNGIAFSEHPYPYEEHGGTKVSARELGVAIARHRRLQRQPRAGLTQREDRLVVLPGLKPERQPVVLVQR